MLRKLKEYFLDTGAGYWAIIYLLCIPIFAVIYTIPVFDFQHSTLSQEKSVLSRKMQIDKLVFDKIAMSGFGSVGGNEYFNFELLSSAYDSLGLTYLLSYVETDVDGNRKPIGTGTDSREVPKIGYLNCIVPLFLTEEIESKAFSLNCMDTDLGSHINMPTISNMIRVNDDVRKKNNELPLGISMSISDKSQDLVLRQLIREFENGISGNTDSFKWIERFSRMFYFSAVTITTLGFGDITPINNYARSAVALHSILGIVFMGLFLNALARTKV